MCQNTTHSVMPVFDLGVLRTNLWAGPSKPCNCRNFGLFYSRCSPYRLSKQLSWSALFRQGLGLGPAYAVLRGSKSGIWPARRFSCFVFVPSGYLVEKDLVAGSPAKGVA